MPRLAAGPSWSVEAALGASASAYSVAPALSESASLGTYLGGTSVIAWSFGLYETCNVVLDATTPQFGLIGVHATRLAKPDDPLLGPRGKTIDFQRVAAGVALVYNGHDLEAGVGVEATVAYLVHGPHGIGVHLGTYFFDASNVSQNTLVALSVSYVFTPVSDRPYAPPRIPQLDEGHACGQLSAYRNAVAEARRQATSACQNNHDPACDAAHARVSALNVRLNKCLLGVDVGPPELPNEP